MKSMKTMIGIAVPTLLAGACTIVPVRDADIDNARAAVAAAQNDPQVVTLAPVELGQAVEAMRRADALWNDRGDLERVHYLAQRSAEAAQRDAERAQAQADANRRDALDAEHHAASAQQQAEAARAQADAARQQAQDAQAHARSLEASLHELEARPTDRGMVVTLSDVLFDSGHAQLRGGAGRVVGNEVSNQELSERRAAAVKLALIDRGIDPGRIVVRGFGEDYPVASNGNAAGRQMNRRVEIVISDEHGMIGSRGGAPIAKVGRGPRG